MKKLNRRAFSVLLLALFIVLGLFTYVQRFLEHGEGWASYFSRLNSLSEGYVTDRNGVLLAARSVTFTAGESVFDVLKRACRANGLQMEFTMTPVYHSAYIEGIGNLYEFDGGPTSGWMYSVNGAYPNCGCSAYALQNGDVVCWRYTCALGADIGGRNEFQ